MKQMTKTIWSSPFFRGKRFREMRRLAQNHKLIHMACGGMKSKAIFQYIQANGLFIMLHSDSAKVFS